MFSNIGRKIKVLAKVFCWLGIIGSIVIGVLMISGSSYFTAISGNLGDDVAAFAAGSPGAFGGIIFIIIGSLVSWISSFALYGFGELVDNSERDCFLRAALLYLTAHGVFAFQPLEKSALSQRILPVITR